MHKVGEWLGRRPAMWLVVLLCVGFGVRLALVEYFAHGSGKSVSAVLCGHDGGEYLDYARALVRGGVAEVPEHSRRHDPGWPMLLVLVAWLPGGATAGWLLQYLLLSGAAVTGARVLSDTQRESWPAVLGWVGAMLFAYPAQVYYGCFLLSESLFALLLVGSMAAYLHWLRNNEKRMHWCLLAFVLSGFAALVRGPGLLLGVAYTMDILFRTQRRLSNALVLAPLAVVPYVLWNLFTKHMWGSELLVHRPSFGLPFSGFANWRELEAARAAYIFACVAFVIASTALLARNALVTGGAVWRVTAIFCAMFVLFHLCLRTLHYIDRDVLTFNYQDRYYVGILPFLWLPWLKWIRWWMVLAAALASVALSAYWGIHYFAAAG